MESKDKNEKRQSGELFDLFADWIVRVLQKRREENSPINAFLKYLRYTLAVLNIVYLLFLICYLIFLEVLGQNWWLTAVASYLPQNLWLIPLFFLIFLNIIFFRKCLLVSVFTLIFWFLFISKFNFGFSKNAEGKKIIVLTNNIGQDNKESLTPFIKSQNPDLILLQEAFGRGRRFTNSFPEYKHFQMGEFAILSKFKILNSTNIVIPEKSYRIIGVRVEIEFNEKRIAVYNIHMPSPRDDLNRAFGLRLFVGIVGTFFKNGKFEKIKTEFDDSWKQRRELYEFLISVFEKEELPFIAAGDFNMPNYGPLYRKLKQFMKDSFAECGSGWGYTFPGSTRNPISLFGPWLRIDYIFAGKGFEPISISTEPKRGSQHRAVSACLVFDIAR